VALQKYLVPPYNVRSRLASSLSIFPLVLRYRELAGEFTLRTRVITAMRLLKDQYTTWLGNRYLPFVSAWGLPASNSNPYSAVITNVGVVERALGSCIWPLGASVPDLDVTGLTIAHRPAQCPRPYVVSFVECPYTS
jgi:hypothetical protein